MLTTLLMLALGRSPSAEAVAARFKQWMAAHPALSVDFQMKLNDAPSLAKGKLIFIRPNRQFYQVSLGNDGYLMRQNSTGVLELDTISRQYELNGPQPGLAASGGLISGLPQYTYPYVLTGGDLKRFVPPGAPFKLESPVSIRGTKTDHLNVSVQSQGGSFKLDAYIDNQGRMLKMRLARAAADQKVTQDFDFLAYGLPSNDPKLFSPIPPSGSVPWTVDTHPYPLQIGSTVPKNLFTSAELISGSRPPSVAGPMVVVYTYGDCEVAASAGDFFRKLTSALKSKGVTMVEMIGGSAKPGPDAQMSSRYRLWDKSGAADRLLRPQGSPTFYLVLGGKIEGLWMGYDPDHSASMLKEIVDSASGG